MPDLPTTAHVGLRRALGLPQAVGLGIGGTVGGGIFVLVGEAAGASGPAALIAFAIAFGAAVLIALPYAELSCRLPRAGGGYAFAREVLGERAGFVMGWGYWGAYLFLSIFITLGFGGYLEAMTGIDRLAGALALVAGCAALNLAGVRVAGGTQLAVVALAVGGLAAFSVWGLPDVDAGRLEPLFPRGVDALAPAALLAFLAFGGFDMISAAAEEVEDPERNLPRAILLTLASVLAIYLAVTLVALGTLGWSALGASPAPLADAAERFGGEPGRALTVGVALLTTAATGNAVLVVTSRISYAMARDELLPAKLAAIGERTGAPWAAVAANGALMALLASIGTVGLGTAAGGFLYALHFVPPLLALALLRRRGDPHPAFETPWAAAVLPLALAGCLLLVAASGATGAAVGSAWLAVGCAAHVLAQRRRPVRAQGGG
jgi:APA family basic amino acid/polyamine antiporter